MTKTLTRLFRFIWHLLDGLRRVVHLVLMLLVLLTFLALLAQAPGPVPDSSALVIAPSGVLVEELEGNPVDRALNEARGDGPTQTLVRDLVEAIDRAADDERIEALVLQLDGMTGGGLIKLQRVGEAIDRFRASGKRVVAVGSGFSQSQYYLAARADEIYMHPFGGLFFQGFGYYRTFFGDAIEKLDIDINVFRTGEHKSLHDHLVRGDMSEAEKQESRVLLDQIWLSYRTAIAEARSLPPGVVQEIADDYLEKLRESGGDTALLAREAGLVDELLTREEVEGRLIELVGEDSDTDRYRQINFLDYLSATRLASGDALDGRSKVAVIVASGMILPGERSPGSVGAESMAEIIRHAREDDAVKAVVLRIDSGGGSQFASELILEELALLREADKPLFVSMSDVAASGGYIIALAGEEIWARPDSITGSIGVVAMLPTVDRALDRLGIHRDGVGTTRYSGDFSMSGGLSPEATEIIQLAIQNSYQRFLEQIVAARGLPLADVEAIAGGRVYTGRDARRLGLIDRLGGLDETVAAIAERAGLGDDYVLRYLQQELSLEEALAVRFLSGSARLAEAAGLGGNETVTSRLIDAVKARLGTLLSLDDPRGIYYHCLCEIR